MPSFHADLFGRRPENYPIVRQSFESNPTDDANFSRFLLDSSEWRRNTSQAEPRRNDAEGEDDLFVNVQSPSNLIWRDKELPFVSQSRFLLISSPPGIITLSGEESYERPVRRRLQA